MSCPDCACGLDHCHGTLVVGDDGTPECTDDCVGPAPERHDLVVPAG